MRMTVTATGEGILLVGVDNPGVIQRQWDQLCYRALESASLDWWKNTAPKKFRYRARTAYPGTFKPRRPTTLAQKWRKFKHTMPLVNYPAGRPPPDKLTIEGQMRLPPRLRLTKRRKVMKANWPAPPVHSQYKREVVAANAADVARAGRVMMAAMSRGVRGVRWRRAALEQGVPIRFTGPQRRRVRRRITRGDTGMFTANP